MPIKTADPLEATRACQQHFHVGICEPRMLTCPCWLSVHGQPVQGVLFMQDLPLSSFLDSGFLVLVSQVRLALLLSTPFLSLP